MNNASDGWLEKQEMKRKLLQMRELLQSTAVTRHDSVKVVELDQTTVGRLSRMDALQYQEIAKASVWLSDLALMQIRAALARIENDEFGICQDCGQAIALSRLRVDPTAVLCISCAGAAEAR